jgi:hypothetical protein
MSIGHSPTITSNGGLTGLSILNHGTETSSWTKLSYPSNVITTSSMPYLYYVQLSVPNTNGVDTNVTINYLPNAYYLHSTDNKFWKVTFDTGSLIYLPLTLPIKTYWAAPMVEIKTGSIIIPSEFTFGTRGGTKETGGGWLDLTSNDYSGSIINGCSYDTDKGAITFDAINQYVTFGNILASLTDLTLECWIKFGSQKSNYAGIISKTLDNSDGYELRTTTYTATTTNLQFRYKGDSAATAAYTAENNRWYHIVATGQSGVQRLYVNGDIVATNNVATTPTANTNELSIAKLAYSTLYLSASIASVKIYDRVLTPPQVIDNFDSMRSRFGI